MNRADVVVIELREESRFLEEPRLGVLVQTALVLDRLDRDLAAELLVAAEIDGPHSAFAEHIDDPDVSDR